jgi:hypothetical protein
VKLRSLPIAILLTLAVTLSACGGGDSKPSKKELVTGLSEGIDKADLDQDYLGCLADGLLKSDVDGKVLKAVAANDENVKISDKDNATLTDIQDACDK